MNRTLFSAALAALFLFCGGCAAKPTVAAPEPSAAAPNSTPIQIAAKPMTEQRILAELLSQLIVEKTDYCTKITADIGGGTSNIQPAMERGDFDLYPEYTSTGWMVVLKHQAGEIPDSEMLAALQQEYHEKYGMTWVGLYGFNNTYTVAVRNEIVQKYNLETCSDLAKLSPKLVFGGNPDYLERADGFAALSQAYGFQFKDVVDIDIGLKYQALAAGDIDATNAYTTDAQLAAADVTTLTDDLGYQVNYFCSTVVREDTLAEYPGLEEVLALMDGILSDKEMRALNYAVEVDGRSVEKLAHDFLATKGLLRV